MDYYSLIEEALLTRLRTLTEFFTKSEYVTDDDAILNRGSDYFIVVTPDAISATRVDGKSNEFNWVILMDVYARFTTQHESKTKMKLIRSALINLLYPACLNHVNGVSRTIVDTSGGLFQDAPERPNYIWQTFNVTVTQRVRFDF